MAFTCLLIDDDSDDREIFALALEDSLAQFNYLTAKNGLDALNMLQADDSLVPCFIFIDLNMPLLDGKSCLREIRKIERLNAVPTIIYTTSSHKRDIEETKNLGASHYIVKPPSVGILTNILQKLFNKQSLPFFLDESIKLSVL